MTRLLALAVLLAASTALADNASGTVAPNARVRVIGERFVIVTRADATGWFHVGNLPVGAYRIEVNDVLLPVRPEVHATLEQPWTCVVPIYDRPFDVVLRAAGGVTARR